MSVMPKKYARHWLGWSVLYCCAVAGLSGCSGKSCVKTKSCAPADEPSFKGPEGDGGSPSFGGQMSLGGRGEGEGEGAADGKGAGGGRGEVEGRASSDTGGLGSVDGDGDGDGDGDEMGGDVAKPPPLGCAEDRVSCDGVCIDPLADSQFCGASGDCSGSKSGDSCDPGEVCNHGRCVTDCDDGLVACRSGCIDPMTDEEFCGALDDCTGRPNVGRRCSVEEVCVQGACLFWQDPATLGSGGGPLKHLDVDLSDQGEALVYWSSESSSSSSSRARLRVSAGRSSGSWTAQTLVEAAEDQDFYYPVLALSPEGGGYLGYFSAEDDKDQDVVLREVDAQGKFDGEHLTLSEGLEKALWLRSAITDDSTFAVAWVEKTADEMDLRVKTRKGNLWLDTLTLAADTTLNETVSVKALPGGELLLLWTESDNQTPRVKWTRYSSDGTWGFPSKTLSNSERVHSPVLRTHDSGGAAVVWQEGEAGNISHRLARFDGTNWLTIGDARDVVYAATSTDITVLPNGDIIRYVLLPELMHVELYSVTTGAWTQINDLGLQGAGPVSHLRSGSDSVGNVVVAYRQRQTPSADPSLWVARFEAATRTWSAPQLMDSRLGAVIRHSLVVSPSGEAVVAWALEGDSGPRAARFGEVVLQ